MASYLVLVIVAFCAQLYSCRGFIDVSTEVVSDELTRYGAIMLGANPGLYTVVQFIYDDVSLHQVPIAFKWHSTTVRTVDETTIWEYVYFNGQQQLIPLQFQRSETASSVTINLKLLRYGFCYEYHYESERLYLDMVCPAVIKKHYPSTIYDVERNRWAYNTTANIRVSFTAPYSTGGCASPGVMYARVLPNTVLQLPCKDAVYSELALHHHKLHLYYDTQTRNMTIFGPREADDYVDAVGTITLLMLALCIWLYWMRDLHGLVQQTVYVLHTPNAAYINAAAPMEQKVSQLYAVTSIWEDMLHTIQHNNNMTIHYTKLTSVPQYDTYLYIAMQNQRIWRIVSYYQIILLDVVILVASTNFLHSFKGHATLYTEEAAALVGDMFITRYLVWWAIACSICMPFIVCIITIYGTIGSLNQDTIQIVRTRRWFTWGYDDVLQSAWRRVIFNVCILSVGSTVMYYTGIYFFGSRTIGIIGVVMIPALVTIGSNWSKIQSYVCVLFPYDTIVLLFLRWAMEVLILTAIHAELPSEIDYVYASNYRNAIGLSAGVAILLITGRDFTWMVLLYRYKRRVTSFAYSMVVLTAIVSCCTLTVHTTIFMVGPIFIDSSSLRYHPTSALYCVVGFGIVLLSFSATWSMWTFHTWTLHKHITNDKQK